LRGARSEPLTLGVGGGERAVSDLECFSCAEVYEDLTGYEILPLAGGW